MINLFFRKNIVYTIENFDGSLGGDKPVAKMTKKELIDSIFALECEYLKLRAERDAIVLTMNKFLSKDHPDELGALFENENSIKNNYKFG